MTPTDIPTFATHQLSLLSTEHDSELSETALLTSTHAPAILQRAGLALLNLHISSQRTGFGGKTLLELGLDPAIATGNGELPEHGLRVGDICAVAEQPQGSERKKIREESESKKVTGVITRVRREEVTVALDKEDADVPSGGKLWLYVASTYPSIIRVADKIHRLIDTYPNIDLN
jgi:DNA polymerase alpha-associated DNA helicase A